MPYRITRFYNASQTMKILTKIFRLFLHFHDLSAHSCNAANGAVCLYYSFTEPMMVLVEFHTA